MRALLVACLAAACVGVAVPVCAQTDDPGVATLREQLQRGDRVSLLVPTGIVRGKVEQVREDALDVRTSSGLERVPYGDVIEAKRRRTRFVLGAAIGAGAGAAAGFPLVSLCENEVGNCGGAFVALVATGAGIGALVDGLVNFERTVFRRDPASGRMAFAPVLAPGGAGLRIAVEW